MMTFGPVPSRRLGQSLGINNIPHKICSYSCAYCQIGRTLKYGIKRESYYDPEEIAREVRERVYAARDTGERIDYLTFVPDGEPTLDVNLETTIEALKPLGVPIGVITNSTLLAHEEVLSALEKADWVSCKVDAVTESAWRKVDRPHRKLDLEVTLESILEFGRRYEGTLVTETMLVRGCNDDEENLRRVAEFLAHLEPSIAYLAIPTRPPAERWVVAPTEQSVVAAHAILEEKVTHVEYLVGYEGNAFASTGNPAEDLLSITAVHPMREDAVDEFLAKTGSGHEIVDCLVARELLIRAEFGGRGYFLRKFGRSR